MKYNGWTNWETWNFKLWIDNESYYAVLELALELQREGKDKYELSKELESWADDMLEAIRIECGFFADVCNTAIKEINFYEIAESYLLEIEEGQVELEKDIKNDLYGTEEFNGEEVK